MSLLPREEVEVGLLREELTTLAARLEHLEADAGVREAVARIAARCQAIIEVSDLVHDEVSGRLDRLEQELVVLRESVGAAGGPHAAVAPGAAAQPYGDLVARVRELTVGLTRPGATVAVVGKGDPALLELTGRTGWHFPRQPDGTYLGYYPRDDAAAVTLLEEARLAGADYVVFPATSLWWLEHYRGLHEHLREHHAVVVHDPASCAIFGLRGSRPVDAGSSVVRPPAADRVRDLVDRLVPSDEPVALVESDVARYRTWARTIVPVVPVGDAEARDDVIDRLRLQGVRFVVLPHRELAGGSAINLWLAGAVDMVIDQRHVCALLEITEHVGVGDLSPPS